MNDDVMMSVVLVASGIRFSGRIVLYCHTLDLLSASLACSLSDLSSETDDRGRACSTASRQVFALASR
jgi:hypothetical protein